MLRANYMFKSDPLGGESAPEVRTGFPVGLCPMRSAKFVADAAVYGGLAAEVRQVSTLLFDHR